MNHNKAC